MTADHNFKAVIDFGTAVLTYNKWTEYKNDAVRKYFRQITPDDVRKLKAGDAIWIDQDPIHPNGKVDGFVKRKVERVEDGGIHFDGGSTKFLSKIYLVDDENPLAIMILFDPQMTDVIGESGRKASALLRRLS